MRYFDESIHGMVTILANECLNGILGDLRESEPQVRPYLVRRAGFEENPVINKPNNLFKVKIKY